MAPNLAGAKLPVRTVRMCVPEKVVHKKTYNEEKIKNKKLILKKKSKCLKIIILRARFSAIYLILVVSLKFVFSLKQRTFFLLSTQMSVSR